MTEHDDDLARLARAVDEPSLELETDEANARLLDKLHAEGVPSRVVHFDTLPPVVGEWSGGDVRSGFTGEDEQPDESSASSELAVTPDCDRDAHDLCRAPVWCGCPCHGDEEGWRPALLGR